MNEGNRLDGPINSTPPKPTTIKALVRFYECEHDGDLGNYINCCFDSGAKKIRVVSTDFDCEESALIIVTIPPWPACGFERFTTCLDDTNAKGLYKASRIER